MLGAAFAGTVRRRDSRSTTPSAYFRMASYTVNKKAVAHARKLIDAKQYVLDSDWGEVAPTADDENAFLKTHSWDEYAAVAPRADRRRDRRDEGSLRIRLRGSQAGPPDGPDRLRLSGGRVAPQVGRARCTQAAPAPRQDQRLMTDETAVPQHPDSSSRRPENWMPRPPSRGARGPIRPFSDDGGVRPDSRARRLTWTCASAAHRSCR